MRFVLAIAALCAVVPGQFLSPPGAVGSSPSSVQVRNLGVSTARVQQFDQLAPAMRISGLELRAVASQVIATTMIVDVVLSSNPPSTAAGSHGADRMVCAQSRVIPVSTAKSPGEPWVPFLIPFDQPFDYDGSGTLTWELRILADQNPTTQLSMEAATHSGYQGSEFTFGQGCSGITISQPQLGSVAISGAPPLSLGAISVGLDSSSFFGAPLPLALPGTSGACFLQHDFLLTTPVLYDSGGSFSGNFQVPTTALVHWQAIGLDRNANPLGAVTSNGVSYSPGFSGWITPSMMTLIVDRKSATGSGSLHVYTGLIVTYLP